MSWSIQNQPLKLMKRIIYLFYLFYMFHSVVQYNFTLNGIFFFFFRVETLNWTAKWITRPHNLNNQIAFGVRKKWYFLWVDWNFVMDIHVGINICKDLFSIKFENLSWISNYEWAWCVLSSVCFLPLLCAYSVSRKSARINFYSLSKIKKPSKISKSKNTSDT